MELSSDFGGYNYNRPRTLHPDNVPLLHVNWSLAETGDGEIQSGGPGFEELASREWGSSCDFWGSWMDAGD